MPEYTAIAAQTVAANQNVLFTEAPIPCTKGLVTHRAGSGLLTSVVTAPSAASAIRWTLSAILP